MSMRMTILMFDEPKPALHWGNGQPIGCARCRKDKPVKAVATMDKVGGVVVGPYLVTYLDHLGQLPGIFCEDCVAALRQQKERIGDFIINFTHYQG